MFEKTTGENNNNNSMLTIGEIVEKLHMFLNDNSCLVVLDDVWEKEVLRQIMIPVASHSTRFIITTRNQEVVQFPNVCCFVHQVRHLTLDQSWVLFEKIALGRHNCEDDEHRVALGKEMLTKCDGLPLAIISLAGLLSTKETIHDWERVRRDVSSKINKEGGPVDYGRVVDMLALSYNDLNHTLKLCFSYMGLFPQDAEIPTGMLVRMWIAEGFFKSLQPSANETVEDVASQCLDELIQRGMFKMARINYAGKVKYI